MKVYTTCYEGHYPDGAVLLVVAEDIDMALIWINKALGNRGLNHVTKADLKLQDTTTRRVDILKDGDY